MKKRLIAILTAVSMCVSIAVPAGADELTETVSESVESGTMESENGAAAGNDTVSEAVEENIEEPTGSITEDDQTEEPTGDIANEAAEGTSGSDTEETGTEESSGNDTEGAETEASSTESIEEAESDVISGSLSDTVTYTIEDGVLTIEGTGSIALNRSLFPEGCTITKLVLKDGVYITDTGYSMTSFTDLKEVVLPGIFWSRSFQYVFRDCTGLVSVTLGEGLTYIPKGTFRGCTNLETVNLPSTLEYIQDEAFEGCRNLTSITIPENVDYIGDYVFAETGLTSIKIPDKVTSIPCYAFYRCSSLTSVTMPTTVKYIGRAAFHGCPIRSIELPESLTAIGKEAFSYCKQLESITIPDNVNSIGASAFMYCDQLKEVKLSEKLTTIEYYAFLGTAISSLTIPSGLTFIGADAFSGCADLTSIILSCQFDQSVVTAIDQTLVAAASSGIVPAEDGKGYTVRGYKVNSKTTLSGTQGTFVYLHTESEPVIENRKKHTATEDGTCESVVYCKDCQAELSRETVITEKAGHIYDGGIYDAATNSRVFTCTICGDTYSEPVEISISNASVTVSSCTYTGRALTPAVTVKLDGKTLVNGTDYKVTCRNNINAGTGTVVITGIGDYKDSVTKTFTIRKGASTISLSAKTAVYTKSAISIDAAKVTGSKGTITYTYYTNAKCTVKTTSKNSGSSYTGGAPKNIGTYYVKASVAADSNCYGAASSAAVLKIVKVKYSVKTMTQTCYRLYTGGKYLTTKAGGSKSSANGSVSLASLSETNAGQAYKLTKSASGNYYYISPQNDTGRILNVNANRSAAGNAINIRTKSKTEQKTEMWKFLDDGLGNFYLSPADSNTTDPLVINKSCTKLVKMSSGDGARFRTGNIKVTAVKLNMTGASMKRGDKITLSVSSVSPFYATKQASGASWTTSNSSFALSAKSGSSVTVTNNLWLLAAEGTTGKITVSIDGASAVCTVKYVKKIPVTGVSLNYSNETLAKGATLQLKATVSPANADNKAVTWKSSNTGVATVDANGKVTAVGDSGTATITVTTKDGSKTASCKVTIDSLVSRINTFMSDSRWANGAVYSSNQHPKLSPYRASTGCCAYALDFFYTICNYGAKEKYGFGTMGKYYNNISELKVGDVLYQTQIVNAKGVVTRDEHYVCVCEIQGNKVLLAEGNVSGKYAQIGWYTKSGTRFTSYNDTTDTIHTGKFSFSYGWHPKMK